ncbi:MAG TPA: OmpA family protein [Candidatus Limiplasma sp.]|nr:OmpA family protein [Candidatus Limiplasma sp.]HRX09334.1 OmpA family protein [Candidatus Limiplasma sp.]
MRRSTRKRGRSSRVDGGAAWISYSDMMAALLLVFVLVLCYTIYQYFMLLETKTAELDAQTALLNSQQETLDDQRSQLLDKQNSLDSALTEIDVQKGLLNVQQQQLTEQEAKIAAANAALTEKETTLNEAQTTLAQQEVKLNAAMDLLQSQQIAMDEQQRKLEDLVGVRTKIIRDLASALTSANLTATVDANTGDIMLESTVFFDYNSNTIKQEGRDFLNRFLPVYLSVLLSDDYSGYLGEIVIEGHTDTAGSYLYNLELSQERALSVVRFCLEMPQLTQKQQAILYNILTAKGRSYSDPVYDANGNVDMDASRRVEFKFRLKDSEMIDEIRNILSQGD